MLLRAALERETLTLDIRVYADEIAVFPLALRLLIHLHETALFLLREKRLDGRDDTERGNVALRLDLSGETGMYPRRFDVGAVCDVRGAGVRESAPPGKDRDASGDAAREAPPAETARAHAADAVLRADLHDLRNAAVEIGQYAHADGASLAEPQRHVAAVIHGNEIRAAGEYEKIGQALCVLLPVRSVGVMGDGRTYEQVGEAEEREATAAIGVSVGSPVARTDSAMTRGSPVSSE